MKKRVLITGATGLVGSAITAMLVEKGYEITALYRSHKSDLPHVQWIHCDMQKADESFFGLLPKVDVVIHNGALVPLSGQAIDELEMVKVNTEFSEFLFRWAYNQNVERVLFTSTYSFLKKPLPEVISETSEVEPLGVYPMSKWEAESLLMSLPKGKTLGIALRIPSPVTTSLENSPKNVVRMWLEMASAGKSLQVMGTGSRTMDFVSVEDIAQAFGLAVEAELNGNEIFNLGSGNTLSMQTLAEQIASAFGVGVEYIETDSNADDRWNVSIAKAQAILGYQPKYTSASVIQKLIDSVKK